MNGQDNLRKMFEAADEDDLREGLMAYHRYNRLMVRLSDQYSFPLDRVVAGFVSLSPNNDYFGNLRSLISVMDGIRNDVPLNEITVSTYKHCRDRAFNYLVGARVFLDKTKGPKITSFYHNVLSPLDNRWVTVDGHVVATWRGKNLTMKEAIIRNKKEYVEIADAIKRLAFAAFLSPNQYQATIWFARKRIFNVKYDPQTDLFFARDDLWRTNLNLSDIKPYQPQRKEPDPLREE